MRISGEPLNCIRGSADLFLGASVHALAVLAIHVSAAGLETGDRYSLALSFGFLRRTLLGFLLSCSELDARLDAGLATCS